VEKPLDGDPLSGVEEHGRTAALGAALLPGVLTGAELVAERQLPLLQTIEDHIDRHHLAHRRRRDHLVGVLLEQDGFGLHVDKEGLLRGGLQRRGAGRRQK